MHRLLGLRHKANLNTGEETFEADGTPALKGHHELIVIDEASMLSKELHALLQAAAGNRHLLFVGDEHQLAPPSDGVLCPVFQPGGVEETFRLTEVLRHDGAILNLATATREQRLGHPPLLSSGGDSSRVIAHPSYKAWQQAAITAAAAADTPGGVQLLAWTNRAVQGLNAAVREARYGFEAPQFVVGERLITHDTIENPEGGAPLLPSTIELTLETAQLLQQPVFGDDDPWCSKTPPPTGPGGSGGSLALCLITLMGPPASPSR